MTQTLFVADDSKTIHTIIQMALKASVYNIVSVNSAKGALEAGNHSPNIILLDYYMPDGSGYDVCRALKSNAQTSSIPIVMLGGTYKNFDENLARQAGADGILMKPFKTDQLIEILDAASTGRLAGGPAPTAPAPIASAPTYQPAPPAPAPAPPPPAPAPPAFQAPPSPTFAPEPAAFEAAPTPAPARQPEPAPFEAAPTPAPARRPEPAPFEAAPTPAPARAPVQPVQLDEVAPVRSGSGLSAVPREEIESMIKDEVKATVKAELPGLLRTILGEVFQQKVLPKLMARADQRVEAAVDEGFTAKIQEQVRTELETLLAD